MVERDGLAGRRRAIARVLKRHGLALSILGIVAVVALGLLHGGVYEYSGKSLALRWDNGPRFILSGCESAARDAVYEVCDDDGCGTAFHIGGGRWLTAAHVADSPHAILYPGVDRGVVGWDGYPATLHWRNPDYPDRMNRSDYAVLQSRHAPAASVHLADAPPSDGQRLFIVGWLGGVKRELAVRAVRLERTDWVDAVWLDGGLGEGSSGAPVIDECGVAYGMIAVRDGSYTGGPAVHQMEWP